VPHASCAQKGGGIYAQEINDVMLVDGSAISGCEAEQVSPSTAAGRPPPQNALAPRAVCTSAAQGVRTE